MSGGESPAFCERLRFTGDRQRAGGDLKLCNPTELDEFSEACPKIQFSFRNHYEV